MFVELPEKNDIDLDDDINILTNDDAPGLPQKYDAFVLFADEDIEYATELIERLEDSGFKVSAKFHFINFSPKYFVGGLRQKYPYLEGLTEDSI